MKKRCYDCLEFNLRIKIKQVGCAWLAIWRRGRLRKKKIQGGSARRQVGLQQEGDTRVPGPFPTYHSNSALQVPRYSPKSWYYSGLCWPWPTAFRVPLNRATRTLSLPLQVFPRNRGVTTPPRSFWPRTGLACWCLLYEEVKSASWNMYIFCIYHHLKTKEWPYLLHQWAIWTLFKQTAYT